jgi:hypothetical protein
LECHGEIEPVYVKKALAFIPGHSLFVNTQGDTENYSIEKTYEISICLHQAWIRHISNVEKFGTWGFADKYS